MNLLDICKANSVPIENGKIVLDPSIKHIKLDIGLSFNSPFALHWLRNEANLVVFGFEANPETAAFLQDGRVDKYHRMFGHVHVENPFLNKTFFILPVALSDGEARMADFYTMGHDLGCSSLFKPNDFFFSKHPEHFLEGKVQVPVFPLQDFLELLPLDQIEYIDYVKIDAQGADLQIVKGGVKGLQEKVVFLTLEADGEDYEQAEQNTEPSITAFMESIGFQKVVRPDVVDPTYVNTKFLHVADSVYICQRI